MPPADRSRGPNLSDSTPGTQDSFEAVARFLVGDAEVPEPADLARHGLEALAYVRVPQPHPQHERWRDAYLSSVATHLVTRAKLSDVVRAWREIGIEVLLFKGFYLAEFLYASPAERFYKDIDVLVHEEAAESAVNAAVAHGWTVAASRRGSGGGNRHSHMEAILSRQGLRIDLHRFVIHCDSPHDAIARRYTAAAWTASREVAWQGTSIRVLDPRDSALMGLVVGRAWSHDRWHLKTPDYRDLEVLTERLGLTRDDLTARADELGCSQSLALVLERCDPWRRRLDLKPPSIKQRRVWTRAVAREHDPRMSWLRRRLVGASPVGLVATLPHLWRARRLAREHADATDLLTQLRAPRTGVEPMTPAERMRLFANVRVGAALVQPSGDRCLIRSLALFEALRSRGEPVTIYFGVDRGGNRHAWLRYPGVAATPTETWTSCPVTEVVATSAPAATGP